MMTSNEKPHCDTCGKDVTEVLCPVCAKWWEDNAPKKTFKADPSPWHPMNDPVDLKVIGKFSEELGECSAAVGRCLIQGIDECEPTTGEPNREWLLKEVADVLANADLVIERFGLNRDAINQRIAFKQDHLRKWHSMAGSAFQGAEGDA
jgi:hypothetical protein